MMVRHQKWSGLSVMATIGVILALALVSMSASAQLVPNDTVEHVVVSRCGAKMLDETQLKKQIEIEETFRLSQVEKGGAFEDNGALRVFRVIFHVLISSDRIVNVPDKVLRAQIDHVNNVFSSSSPDSVSVNANMRFEITKINRVVNDDLARKCYDPTRKRRFLNRAQKNPKALHIFVCDLQSSGGLILGTSQLPCDTLEPDSNEVFDGALWVHYKALLNVPGVNYKAIPYYDQGNTVVHELGHVLGLFHTFANSETCSGLGDLVDDTPMESIPNTEGCNVFRDTCPNDPGYDPVQNFMDYSVDSCMDRFTPLQVARMRSESARCLSNRYREVFQERACSVVGPRGPAPVGIPCKSECYSGKKTPNGLKPNNMNKRWCWAGRPLWGTCECPLVSRVLTNSPSAAPTTLVPTRSPTKTPSSFDCSDLPNNSECANHPLCRKLNVAPAKQKSMSASCKRDIGCKFKDTFCDGLCPAICKLKTGQCRLEGNTCVAKK